MGPKGEVYEARILQAVIFPIFQNHQNTGYL